MMDLEKLAQRAEEEIAPQFARLERISRENTGKILDSFSQACPTFVGQNYGAGQLERCKKTLLLSLLEGYIVLGIAVALILHFGHPPLALFNNDPEVIALGYTRMRLVLLAHVFSLLYNTMSGYLRGFGISLTPAVLTMLGVCGIRILWVNTVFANVQTFHSVMMVYPISLAATALMIFIALIYYKPSRRFAPKTAAENGRCSIFCENGLRVGAASAIINMLYSL